MTTAQIQINQPILKRFTRLLQSGRMAHAYLFIGPDDIGKSETALAIAKFVNCESNTKEDQPEACDQCPSCRKIDSGNHPDIFVIDSGQEQSIRIAQIRELINKNQLRAFEARKKVFIIKNAEKLTLDGSNALLKTLEEPTPDSLLLLTTSVPEKNLDTIKSRCQAVHFFPVSKDQISTQLKNDYCVEGNAAHFLASFSEGCLGKARRLNESKFLVRKNEIIDNIVFQGNNETYIKDVLADREHTKEVLDVLLSWFRDLLLVKVGAEEDQLVHVDRIDDLMDIEAKYSFHQVKDIVDSIVNAARLLGENLNVKIPLTLLREKIWTICISIRRSLIFRTHVLMASWALI